MALKNKYQREKQQYSNDGGMTWLDVSPAKYRRGRLIEEASEDCNTVEWREVLGSWFCIGYEPTTEYRWVVIDGQYECVGYNKYAVEKKQQSSDGGTTWTDVVPLETKAGSLIQANSEDCGYVPPTPGDYSNQYLTFVASENGTFTFTPPTNAIIISYSTDNGNTWTEGNSVSVNNGDKVFWKGTPIPYPNGGIGTFSATGNFDVQGNPMSLLFGDNFKGQTDLTGKNYAFYRLFSDNSKVINAENLSLPATTLANNCYQYMFYNCTSLVNAPQLPATTLTYQCYLSMFNGCSSLVNAPALPATTLANQCYEYMFARCTSLTTAPALPATTLTEWCYFDMFSGCTSLTSAPVLPATTLTYQCYLSMFNGCTSLVNAPALPATTLAEYCYSSMFQGCSSLTSAPVLPATTLTTYCYQKMFYGCTSLVNAPELPATTLANGCYQYMFYNCTSLTTAPALPATTLTYECYEFMFNGCTSLNYIKCLATDISASSSCTRNWVSYVASTGTFTKASSMTSWTTGTSGIPEGWTVQNA